MERRASGHSRQLRHQLPCTSVDLEQHNSPPLDKALLSGVKETPNNETLCLSPHTIPKLHFNDFFGPPSQVNLCKRVWWFCLSPICHETEKSKRGRLKVDNQKRTQNVAFVLFCSRFLVPICISIGALIEQETFGSQTFRAPPGYPGKIPGYPAK